MGDIVLRQVRSTHRLGALVFAVALTQLQPALVDAQTAPGIEAVPPELAVRPDAGRRTVSQASAPPAFCTGTIEPLRTARMRASSLRDVFALRRIVAGTNTLDLDLDDFLVLGQLACAHAADANAREWSRNFRQLIVNQSDMDDATIDGLIALAIETGGEFRPSCDAFSPDRFDQPNTRIRARMLSALCQGRRSTVPTHQLLYWYDRIGGMVPDSGTPHLERLGFLSMLFPRSRYSMSDGSLIHYLIGKGDLDAVDVRAAVTELARVSMGPSERRWAQGHLFMIRADAARAFAMIEEAARQDATLAELIGALRTQALAQYETETRPHAGALNRVAAIEDAWLRRDRAVLGSCANDLRASFVAFLASRHPRSEADVSDALATPTGNLLAAGWARCELDAGNQGVAESIHRLLQPIYVARGPRTYVLQQLQRTVAERAATRPDSSVSAQRFYEGLSEPEASENWRFEHSGAMTRSAGVVAAARREGDFVNVTFRTEHFTVPVLECRPTNRISRIESNGDVHYVEECRQIGTQPAQSQPEPVSIHHSQAGGIAAGVYLEADRGNGTDTRAVPLRVRPRADGNVVAFLGTTF